MLVAKTLQELRRLRFEAILSSFSRTGRRPQIGFVPTMGSLHAGHRALLDRMAECELRIASIFVNPLQFGAKEDLSSYPRSPEQDHVMCEEAGVDILWEPHPSEMYAQGFQTTVSCGGLAQHWCGASRPGHFDGVATVVAKLFGQIQPDRAYFGEKDYQQYCIVRRLSLDLDIGVDVVPCPTVREADGLAMSSRNAYLSPEERRTAPILHQALLSMREAFGEGEAEIGGLCAIGTAIIHAGPGLQLEYLGVADPLSLEPRDGQARSGDRILVAARLGKARLIDNEEL